MVRAVPLAAAAGDKHCESHLCRVRLIAHQGSAVSEEREDAQEGAPGHLLCEDQRVERSEGTAPCEALDLGAVHLPIRPQLQP